MASDLAGMFSQLNNAITGSPLNSNVGMGLLHNVSQNVGQMSGFLPSAQQQMPAGVQGPPQSVKPDPYSFMTPQAKKQQGLLEMGGLDLKTPEGLAQAAQVAGKMGDTGAQVQFAQAAQKETERRVALKKEQTMLTSLADRAEKQGMSDMATSIRSGAHPDLKKAAEDVRNEERRQIAMNRGLPGRRAIARQAGFTDAEIEEQGLMQLEPEELLKVVDGEKGEIKAFQTASGEDVMLAADSYGRVWINGKRMRPEEAGLKQAPRKTQEVVSAADMLVKSATDLAATDFNSLHEGAKDAAKTMEVTDRALNRLDAGAATGAFAPLEIALGKAATELGIDGKWASDAQNAEAYMSTMGNEVATVIKDFGAGTGLSDADREYALKIAAGDVKMDESTLRWLLNARRLAARNVMDRHSGILNKLVDKGLDPTAFQILSTTTTPTNTVPSGSKRGTYNPETGKVEWR